MTKDNFGYLSGILLVMFFAGLIIYSTIQDHQTTEKYGEQKFEFVITDLYDDLGSNWHLIGGRATEPEYHVVYKFRITNRPDDPIYNTWRIDETTISGGKYRKLKVGQKLYGNSKIFPR